MEDVALKPDVATLWVASRVHVKTVTLETDLPVLVSQFEHGLSTYFIRLIMYMNVLSIVMVERSHCSLLFYDNMCIS